MTSSDIDKIGFEIAGLDEKYIIKLPILETV